MPELPEVETVVKGLRNRITGKELERIEEYRHGTLNYDFAERKVCWGTIESIRRRGKFIILQTSLGYKLTIHLRMTGRLIFRDKPVEITSHTRARLVFLDGSSLIFDDPRTFGRINVYKKNSRIKCLEKMGPEPLAEFFNEEYLFRVLHTRKAPVKNLLLNQQIIAGLGNIYVTEILHRAGVSPLKRGDQLSDAQVREIVFQTKQVLREAIRKKGTTISDYRNVENTAGSFQNQLRIYGKDRCSCGNKTLRIKQAGRSSYYCPRCQK
ncbi:MAG: bifunctional DNA-formamidopyrimidine glycosylase/DNA-(apurinic or apyrimidinic site) lyase [Candidatus Cloacimonetes bacterium]|nr:bifunctional DNA-formamidopyrimidine glycosylase/DNA-(apurinic or apyrimidinic site) lyase [Candidatus Cloacimonadota bacterium]